MDDHAQIKLFYNGAPVKLLRINRAVNANNQPIMVIGEGLVGFADGSGECTMDFDCRIPIGGTEFDFEADLTARAFVDLQVFIGARTYAGRGKLQTVTTTQESGDSSRVSTSWQGEFKPAA